MFFYFIMLGINVDNERNAITDNRYGSGKEGSLCSLRVHRERSWKDKYQFYFADFYADV